MPVGKAAGHCLGGQAAFLSQPLKFGIPQIPFLQRGKTEAGTGGLSCVMKGYLMTLVIWSQSFPRVPVEPEPWQDRGWIQFQTWPFLSTKRWWRKELELILRDSSLCSAKGCQLRSGGRSHPGGFQGFQRQAPAPQLMPRGPPQKGGYFCSHAIPSPLDTHIYVTGAPHTYMHSYLKHP